MESCERRGGGGAGGGGGGLRRAARMEGGERRVFLVCPRELGAGQLAAAAEALAPGAVESVRAELVPEKGVAYMTFRTPADAQRALDVLRERASELVGCKVKAMLAEPRVPNRGGGSSRASSRDSGGGFPRLRAEALALAAWEAARGAQGRLAAAAGAGL